ncbi:hypothetical protein XELAEV_18019284mg [Xenopus laevis]|uniref:G-protein coupled receptors family 3 profile domain-containing protein n=1 Tax=Xenopus laevis TaxID=8355 RepID=A0A974DFB2_XENLA|nr:hypothetical protein XELAEV_18019284mg [Xenopus laevis]
MEGDLFTSQNAVKAQERVLLNKTLFDSPAEKSQIKRCPSCESVVSKESWHNSGGRLDTPEIVSVLGQLTDQLTQLAWNGNFKRLKVFSGTDPEPTGEESFESWRDSTVVSTTMRRKILESLRSPDVDVVKSYMVGHTDATSGDLIEVLEVTFGPVESATEMLYRFHSTFQKEKEDLSVYRVLLEQGPRLLVSRGAITDDEMDSLRIHQPKRGTLNSDPVAMTIRAHDQDKLPPGYVALMERVRREEAETYVRFRRSSTSGHTEKSLADAKLLEENCSDSPEEDKVLSRDKTTVENLVDMKVVPETSNTPDRFKGLGLVVIPTLLTALLSRHARAYGKRGCCQFVQGENVGDMRNPSPVCLPVTSSSPVACVLAKTITVVIAFKATKPGSRLRKWTGVKVSYCLVLFCVSFQLLVCVIWLIFSHPFLELDIDTKPGVIIVNCNEGSSTAFWCMLGYLGLLATTSFIVVFLARRLPDSFNEAKFITFSMLAFLSVWVSFIPAYLSAQGMYTVAMEVFAILSSSWAVVGCIFVPKCYIILFKPNMNSREFIFSSEKDCRCFWSINNRKEKLACSHEQDWEHDLGRIEVQ